MKNFIPEGGWWQSSLTLGPDLTVKGRNDLIRGSWSQLKYPTAQVVFQFSLQHL